MCFFIVDYIDESGIKFYSDKELVELINQDAQYYVDNGLNAELIALYYETFVCTYPSSQIAPKLLTDGKGNLILDENVKVFGNPTQRFDLPGWSKMYFLNPDLETTLSKRLHAQSRNLTDKLKTFILTRSPTRSLKRPAWMARPIWRCSRRSRCR